ncbi:hypothetical protein PR048_022765 [Dryococelus australis]|uniref:Uncharacterized protein n=1 Tax=Dryococelus australis TaxID=614101 RepID=A0ABQ9GSA3_9NEOP|nr:hypothetical protein PR048_022765 [Dryococelus australis]
MGVIYFSDTDEGDIIEEPSISEVTSPTIYYLPWLQKFFSENGIDPTEFYSDFLTVANCTFKKKINGFVIMGKSTKPALISREHDRSGLHLNQLPGDMCILYEEPDNTNFSTWKLILEGATIATDIKHSDKEKTKRITVFITTNIPLWSWTQINENAPLEIRDQIHEFRKLMSRNNYREQDEIPPQPHIITHKNLH